LTTLTPIHLVHLAKAGEHTRLDEIWSQALTAHAPADPFAEVIEALIETAQGPKALALAAQGGDLLDKAGRSYEGLVVMAPVFRSGIHDKAVSAILARIVERAFGNEGWLPAFKERARLNFDSIAADSFRRFETLLGLLPGRVVYHPGGWGVGVVEELRLSALEILVRFTGSPKPMDMPLESAEESLRPLGRDDIRAMKLQNVEELRRLCEADPCRIIRQCARLYRGRISSSQLKEMLADAMSPSDWNNFWKKAKAASAVDPFIQVEGSQTRPMFVMRAKPLSLGDEARLAIRGADDLAGTVGILRDILMRATDEAARASVLDLAAEVTQQAMANGGHPYAHLLEAVLLLEENGRSASKTARQVFEGAQSQARQNDPFAVLVTLRNPASRSAAFKHLPEILGEGWAQKLREGFHSIPDDLKEQAVEDLVAAKEAYELAPLFAVIAPHPHRQPMTTFLLARLQAEGVFDGHQSKPSTSQMLRVIIHLCKQLAISKKGSVEKGRVLARIVTLLTRKKNPFLMTLLADVSKDEVAAVFSTCEKAGEDYPEEITKLVTDEVRRKYPDILLKPEVPYWLDNNIYVTKRGLQRRQEEFRLLRDVKIPANSAAIGAAASLGDLSENSEWESAIEEQRNLTGRATEMEAELKRARLLEELDIPRETVAPGQRIAYTDLDANQRHIRAIVGPWDVEEGSDAISYRAPLAKGLLGKKIGEVTTIQVPGGEHRVRIESIEVLF
jgi:transcription elongation factor GreA